MFYLENNHLYRYYCRYDNQLFKTEADYLEYLNEKGITPEETMLWRRAKISSKNQGNADGSWMPFNIAFGTTVFDERDISKYYVENETAAKRLLTCYDKYNDYYIDRCYFDGYDNSADYTYVDSGEEIAEFNAVEENTKYAFYVISYLPDDEELRAKRYAAHMLQIKNMKRLAPNTRIYVIAQNWKDEEYLNDASIVYHKYGKLGAGKARNVALKLLYDSNYDYAVLTDDDITLKETKSAKQFFKEMRENTEKFTEMDVIQSRCLIYQRLGQNDLDMSEYTSKFWHFVQEYEGQVHMCFIKNFKKYYDTEEYQNEVITPKNNTGFDDTDFFLALNQKQYKVYKAMFLYRYLGCMVEEESVVENAENGCFIYDNLTAARSKYLERFSDGGWDYWSLRAPLPDISIAREVESNTYDELDGLLIQKLKDVQLFNKLAKDNEQKLLIKNNDVDENGNYIIL